MTAPFGFPKLYRFVDIVGIFFRFLHIFKEGGAQQGYRNPQNLGKF